MAGGGKAGEGDVSMVSTLELELVFSQQDVSELVKQMFILEAF